METLLESNYNNSRRQNSACKRARLMTSHVNIYFCQRPLQNSSLENIATMSISLYVSITVEPRYLELAYFELTIISKWKSGPCFNMKLWQQVTK